MEQVAMEKGKTRTIQNALFFSHVRALLEEGKSVSFSLRGNSMMPFLRDGDSVTVAPIGKDPIRWGQVILAYSPVGYVLHRVVKIQANYVELAGDANLVQLERVGLQNILGRATKAHRGGKEISFGRGAVWLLAGAWYKIRPLRRIWQGLSHKLRKGARRPR